MLLFIPGIPVKYIWFGNPGKPSKNLFYIISCYMILFWRSRHSGRRVEEKSAYQWNKFGNKKVNGEPKRNNFKVIDFIANYE